LHWHHHINDRSLPWKNEKDPYKIWLSEVILQQTTAQQGLKYYLKFIQQYPTVQSLAAAADEAVFKLWEGLGYYSRCKNLLKAARLITDQHQGIFPNNYNEVRALPGIGPYTSAAIMSFAFNQAYAVVDGNVYRVLSRFFGERTPIDTTEGKKIFNDLAQSLIDYNMPADYNQAIMDLGATVCTPKRPQCTDCPLNAQCYVYKHDWLPEELPIKSKKIQKTRRYFHYFIIQDATGALYFEKREAQDIWQNLYQPFLIETTALDLDMNEAIKEIKAAFPTIDINAHDIQYMEDAKQTLTHRIIHSRFYYLKLTQTVEVTTSAGAFYTEKDLKKLAFPQTIFSFMSKNPYF